MKRVDPKEYTRKYYLTDATGYNEYKKSAGKILEPRLAKIVTKIPNPRGMRILDVGCGRGELVYWALRNGAKEALGIDYSKEAIKLAKEARKKWPKRYQKTARFIHQDAKDMYFKKPFDAVLMTEVLEHLYEEEQIEILKNIHKILKDTGFLFIHTAPSKTFNNFTYKYWCYPISTFLVRVNNFIIKSDYPNIAKPKDIRTESHKIMHVNEPTYFSLKKVFKKTGFSGTIFSTNITIAKPILGWKDRVFNSLVYLNPISFFPPFNIFFGNDFYSILRKK